MSSFYSIIKVMKVYIETMGCQMNKSDTERMLGMLSHFGYEETKNQEEADLLMVNTCSIRQPSEDKAFSQLGVWGKWKKNKNIKIALIDERDEIASSYMGKDYNDVGERTFVLSGYSKEEGFSHAVRSLSSDIIIADEIGGREDFNIISYAIKRGVKIIATLHGDGIFEIKNKREFSAFKNIVVLDKNFDYKIYKFTDGENDEF